jgi:hypothetical protein
VVNCCIAGTEAEITAATNAPYISISFIFSLLVLFVKFSLNLFLLKVEKYRDNHIRIFDLIRLIEMPNLFT